MICCNTSPTYLKYVGEKCANGIIKKVVNQPTRTNTVYIVSRNRVGKYDTIKSQRQFRRGTKYFSEVFKKHNRRHSTQCV